MYRKLSKFHLINKQYAVLLIFGLLLKIVQQHDHREDEDIGGVSSNPKGVSLKKPNGFFKDTPFFL